MKGKKTMRKKHNAKHTITFLESQVDELYKYICTLSPKNVRMVVNSFSFLGVDIFSLFVPDSLLCSGSRKDQIFSSSLSFPSVRVGDKVKVIDGRASAVYEVRKLRFIDGVPSAFIVNPSTRFGFWIETFLLTPSERKN